MSGISSPQAAIRLITAFAHHPPLAPLTASQIAFFATAATVIPVLYLALAVQGPAYWTLIRIANRSAELAAARARTRGKTRWGIGLIGTLAISLANLILLYAGFGEFQALNALYHGTQDADGSSVLLSATFLIILVAATPVAPLILRQCGPRAVKDVLNQSQEGQAAAETS